MPDAERRGASPYGARHASGRIDDERGATGAVGESFALADGTTNGFARPTNGEPLEDRA